jgi:uncharacterized membrane protein YccC
MTVAQSIRISRCLNALAEVLGRMSEAIGNASSPFPVRERARLPGLARRIEEALNGRIKFNTSMTANPLNVPVAIKASWLQTLVDNSHLAVDTLRANLSPNSKGVRHAARLCFATTLAFIIVRTFNIPFGYWATMATLFVLQPVSGTTKSRSMERAMGSAAGAALAAGIGLVIRPPLDLSLVVFPLVWLTMALRRVSYSLYVVFLTPSFVLVADFATPANELMYAVARLANNVLGCLTALLATYLIWPMHKAEGLTQALARAVDANLTYLSAAVDNSRTHLQIEEVDELRRVAGLASSDAEEVYRLNWSNRSSSDHRAITVLTLLRRMAGTAAILQSTCGFPDGTLANLDAISAALESIRKTVLSENAAELNDDLGDNRLAAVDVDALQHLYDLAALLRRKQATDSAGSVVKEPEYGSDPKGPPSTA